MPKALDSSRKHVYTLDMDHATVLSLFSGCGGLDLGLQGGFYYLGQYYPPHKLDFIWANDNNKAACKTLSINFPEMEVICGDIVQLLEENIILPEADVVVGGFPCQDFSLAGKRGGLTVNRGKLYLSMVEVVQRTQPKSFIAENVKGLLIWENGLAIQTIIEDFQALNYEVQFKLFNLADYGIPQTRERVIIYGVRKDLNIDVVWPQPTHHNSWVSSYDAIGDLEDDDILNALPNSSYSKAKLTPNSQGNKPIKRDHPAPTMRAEHHGNIEYHYSLPRRLSAREAARLQTFPDTFEFFNSTSDAYRQIGNAVPPVFGWHLGGMIQKALQGID